MVSPKKKFKTFTYENNITWSGNRAGNLEAEGKPAFRVASPPEFKGEEGVWSPEDLFVASVNICLLTTFLSFAFHKDLPLESYTSDSEGFLERGDNGYEFTKIILRPKIVVSDQDAADKTEKILHDAHDKCLISNSIKGEVAVEPEISVVA